MAEIPVSIIAENIERVLSEQASFALVCFWHRCDDDRLMRKLDLERALKGVPAIPIVLRAPLFNDPNAWASDVVRLLDEQRLAFEVHAEAIAAGRPCALVVIARGDLSVGQASSPATLPSWFPRYGGQEIMALARDLRQLTCCSLGDEVGGVEQLSELLFRLELALSSRVAALLAEDRHHGLSFWDSYLKARSGYAGRAAWCAALQESVQSVGSVQSFRPSMRAKSSLIAAMWSLFCDETPARMIGRAKDICGFLKPPRVPLSTGSFLLPILFRGVGDAAQDEVTKYCRDLIVVVGASCQLTTAAAHADQYGLVNAELLGAQSRDLRRFLSSSLGVFEQ